MSDYGIKVSKSGIDVKIADPTDLTYSSKWSNFKIHSVIDGTVDVGGIIGNLYTGTVASPINYPPVFLALLQDPVNTTRWYVAGGRTFISSGYAGVYYMSNNNFVMAIQPLAPGLNKTWNFKIVVFVDKFTGTAESLPAVDNYGMKISKSGGDVKSAKDTEMSFFSKFSNLSINLSDSVSASGGTTTITHNLGYLPIAMVFMREPYATTVYDPLPTWFVWDPNAQDAGLAQFYVTTTTMVITYTVPANNNNVTFKYLIFNERFN